MSRYPNACAQPLDIIRVNECESGDAYSLRVTRFQALWNEIERLQSELDEQGKMLDRAQDGWKKAMDESRENKSSLESIREYLYDDILSVSMKFQQIMLQLPSSPVKTKPER